MIEKLLAMEEGKTLEFKESTASLAGIIKTVVAFANTAGGTIVVGVEDKTKVVVGLAEPLEEEMRIANKIADSVMPFLSPIIDIQTYRSKPVILIRVPYAAGPYYIKSGPSGRDGVAYVRFGSTNRVADEEMLTRIKTLAKNVTFDELPCPHASLDTLDWECMKTLFANVGRAFTKSKAQSVGIVTPLAGAEHPSNGGVLMFGKDRASTFPDAIVRCVRFAGSTKEKGIDHREIDVYLTDAVDEVLHFIAKNTFKTAKIGRKQRTDVPQYPPEAVREVVTNALVHTDYAITGASIIVAIFDDRLEVTNPGAIPYGLSLEDALAGSSRARNRVIARTFHLLGLIEQWGSGLQKIVQACRRHGLTPPRFEEIGSQFRVTMYAAPAGVTATDEWREAILVHLQSAGSLSVQDAARLWDIDVRSARRRIAKLVKDRTLKKIGTSKHDPHSRYVATGGYAPTVPQRYD